MEESIRTQARLVSDLFSCRFSECVYTSKYVLTECSSYCAAESGLQYCLFRIQKPHIRFLLVSKAQDIPHGVCTWKQYDPRPSCGIQIVMLFSSFFISLATGMRLYEYSLMQ